MIEVNQAAQSSVAQTVSTVEKMLPIFGEVRVNLVEIFGGGQFVVKSNSDLADLRARLGLE